MGWSWARPDAEREIAFCAVTIVGDDAPEYPIFPRRQGWEADFKNVVIRWIHSPVPRIDPLFVGIHDCDCAEEWFHHSVKPDPDLGRRFIHRPPHSRFRVVREHVAPSRRGHEEQPHRESSRATPEPWQPVIVAVFAVPIPHGTVSR